MQQVVLVDEENNEIGRMAKEEVHSDKTPLHRGLSVFLFNSQGELLLQQRGEEKTFPLIWSNSCCGHVLAGEKPEEAARRHLEHELGITETELHLVLPDFRYTAEMNGIKENEICPVFVAFSGQEPEPNPEEVAELEWIGWEEYLANIRRDPTQYSSWSAEEALLLERNEEFHELLRAHAQL